VIALLQRVTSAQVDVGGQIVGAIGPGLLAFVAVQKADDEAHVDRLVERMLTYRMFSDAAGKMNADLGMVGGDLLIVPEFTLAADTRKGTRPSFSPAAPPPHGRRLFDYLVERARRLWPSVAAGRFGADMKVALVNDGPVTFWLEVAGQA
jgi:D-tyrosyl-tRNA(Tyr) deacylase